MQHTRLREDRREGELGYVNAQNAADKSVMQAAVKAFNYSLQMRLQDPDFGRMIEADWCDFFRYMAVFAGLAGSFVVYNGGARLGYCVAPAGLGVGVAVGLNVYEGVLSRREEAVLRGVHGRAYFTPDKNEKIQDLIKTCGLKELKYVAVGVSWSNGDAGVPTFEIPVWAL
jgi:hypothetical protein